MANTRNRESLHTNASVSSHDRPKSGDAAKKDKDMWSSMLDSVASGKRLPEKNVLVLGRFGSIPGSMLPQANLSSRRYH